MMMILSLVKEYGDMLGNLLGGGSAFMQWLRTPLLDNVLMEVDIS